MVDWPAGPVLVDWAIDCDCESIGLLPPHSPSPFCQQEMEGFALMAVNTVAISDDLPPSNVLSAG